MPTTHSKKEYQTSNVVEDEKKRNQYESVSGRAYPHQVKTAMEIMEYFRKGVRNHIVVAKTQVGKTGTAGEVIARMVRDGLVKLKNVFLITNLNDSSWDVTMADRFPAKIIRNMYRRSGFHKLASKFNRIPNDQHKVIIIDEPQYGAGINQSTNMLMIALGLKSTLNFVKKNVSFIQLSATFDKCSIVEAKKDETLNHIYYMEAPPEYNGFEDLDIRDYSGFTTTKQFEDEIRLFDKFKYHLVRVTWSIKEKKYRNHKCPFIVNYDFSKGDFKCIRVGCNPKKGDTMTIKEFNKLLLQGEPEAHTICFIKQGFRASNTIGKNHLGHQYDSIPLENITDASICQSLPGRACGYGYPEYYNGPAITRCHKPSIEAYSGGVKDYYKLVKNGFTTTKRDAYNRDSYLCSTSLPSTIEYKDVSIDDLFKNGLLDHYVLKLVDKDDAMNTKDFRKFIKETIERYYTAHIFKTVKIENNRKKSKPQCKTPMSFDKTHSKLFRVKKKSKFCIVTERSLNKYIKELPTDMMTFQCIPVYKNRDPESKEPPYMKFVYRVYHKDENKMAEDVYDKWLKENPDKCVEEFDKYYEDNRSKEETGKYGF